MFGFQELRDVWTNLPKHPLQVDNCKDVAYGRGGYLLNRLVTV